MMNSGSHSLIPGCVDGAFQRQWRQQLAAWRRLLARCGRKAGRKRVHKLRVATLRLEALLEFWLRGNEGDPGARAVKHWSKQAVRLRRALQPARSAAVYLGKLAWLRGQESAGGQDCLRQIDRLELRFEKRRRSAEKKLMEEIGKRRARLERWSERIEETIPAPVAGEETAGAEVVRELVAGLVAEFPILSEDCLHAYRKGIKKVHYLAEFFAAGDARAVRQAEALGKIQAAIGEWRDWQLLAGKAGRVFKDREGGLPGLLTGLETESLRKALHCSRHFTAQLLEDRADVIRSGRSSRKMPVQSAGLPSTTERRKRA